MRKGQILSELPPPGGRFSRVKQLYDWDKHVATAVKHTGSVVLAETHVPVTHINSLRQYKLPPFVTPDGAIEVSYRNSKVDPSNGVRYADVYLQWKPTTKETE